MWEIWANKLLPKALKSCPKYNKSPNLVTLALISFPKELHGVSLVWMIRLVLAWLVRNIFDFFLKICDIF